jgi:hypothetical protein
MQWLVSLLTSGKVFLLVAAVQLLELAALALHHRLTGRGLALRRLLPMLGAGVGLALAASAGVTGLAPWTVAAALLLSLAAHLVDLRARWRLEAQR